jgi:hypothetical protein
MAVVSDIELELILPPRGDIGLPMHEERIASYPLVRAGTGVRGRGLFAKHAATSGALLVREEALLWQRGDARGTVHCALPVAHADAVMLAMAPFHAAPPTAPLPRREVMRATMAANSFEIATDPPSGDAALFPIICLSNHSCTPNAVVQEVDAPSSAPVYALTVRLGVDLTPGEEVLVSYTPRTWPKRRRAAACRDLWGFTCACVRCSDTWDDTICVRTACCSSGRAYFPDPPSTTAMCLECGAASDIAFTPAARADEEGTLGAVSFSSDATVADLRNVAALLTGHPVLTVEDARIFAALAGLAGHLGERVGALQQQEGLEEGGEEEAEGLQTLFESVMGSVATAALRVRFVSPADMGLVIEMG